MNQPLHQEREAIVRAVAAANIPRAAEVAHLVDRSLKNAARSARNGPKNMAGYSQRMRAAIRLALLTAELSDGTGRLLINCLGHLSPGVAQQELLAWIENKGPAAFGLRRVPWIEPVRQVISEAMMVSRSKPFDEAGAASDASPVNNQPHDHGTSN